MSDIDKSNKVLTGAGLSTLWSAVKSNATTTAQTLIDSSVMSNSDIDYAIAYGWNGQLGGTLTIDGIECIAIAKDITIQGSTLKNIAIDKNYDLGHYFQYTGTIWGKSTVSNVSPWVWGGYGTETGTIKMYDVGMGLSSTSMYLAESANATSTFPLDYSTYPLLYKGLTDFRAVYGENWFLPSILELWACVDWVSELTFESSTGAYSASSSYWWSSTDTGTSAVQCTRLSNRDGHTESKGRAYCVRLCRAF